MTSKPNALFLLVRQSLEIDPLLHLKLEINGKMSRIYGDWDWYTAIRREFVSVGAVSELLFNSLPFEPPGHNGVDHIERLG